MKNKYTISLLLLACISGVAIAAKPDARNQKTLEAALGKYLADRGDLCLAKYDWPIYVSAADMELGTRDALQLPVLEKLGLVTSTSGTVQRKVDEVEEAIPAKRYELTEMGRNFYLEKDMAITNASGKTVEHHGDFCAGKLFLNKIVAWDKPNEQDAQKETTVTYTYKFAAADWARDPEARKVFPMVDRMLKGEGSLQLQQRFRQVGKTWVAVSSLQ